MRNVLLASMLVASAATTAAQPTRPPLTAAEFALQAVSERPRTYASFCIASNPAMKVGFERALSDLSMRVQDIGKSLLASEPFEPLTHKTVPQILVDAFEEQNGELLSQLKATNAAPSCARFLANVDRIDGDLLKAGVMQALSSVQAALAAIEKGMLK